MRLKEDSSSWRAGGIVRRDSRNTKADPETAKHHSTKNRKRWCRGKEGVEHEKLWVLGSYMTLRLWENRCKNCGKKFETWYNSSSSFFKRPKPEGIPDNEV